MSHPEQSSSPNQPIPDPINFDLDVFVAVSDIQCGNQPPPAYLLARNNTCTYYSATGHWQSHLPVLRRDAFHPPPDSSGRSPSGYAQPPQANSSRLGHHQ
ncbi:uncharacterized protein VP01_1789g7 [Puccinia sorghi]|uniref:Uncharacterized protein n=1 Tax=Puccinia sorghi TaxID=27349 RepID=A0A0L6VEH6_9BASI|nr:uncharacterized protein VP01_1789g7 [Puccinia sorghi]